MPSCRVQKDFPTLEESQTDTNIICWENCIWIQCDAVYTNAFDGKPFKKMSLSVVAYPFQNGTICFKPRKRRRSGFKEYKHCKWKNSIPLIQYSLTHYSYTFFCSGGLIEHTDGTFSLITAVLVKLYSKSINFNRGKISPMCPTYYLLYM